MMLGLGFGIKTKIFGLGYVARGLGLAEPGLGFVHLYLVALLTSLAQGAHRKSRNIALRLSFSTCRTSNK